MEIGAFFCTEPLFPAHLQKVNPSLYELCMDSIAQQILQCLLRHESISPARIRAFRKYTRQNLPFHIKSELLDRILPSDRWKFPCLETKERMCCKLHWECTTLYTKMPLLIELMFSEDITRLHINLRKTNDLTVILESLLKVIQKLPKRDYPLLKSLVLDGGTKYSDNCIIQIEELVDLLSKVAVNLENLHIPVASNIVLMAVSRMPNLRAFRCDRSRKLNRNGILGLCHRNSLSKYKLEVCHIGIFRHNTFEKTDIANFVRFMDNLKEYSFLDQERSLCGSPWTQRYMGEKVLSYSVFKLAIKKHEMKDPDRKWPGGRIGPELLATNLREISVVDRSLKPVYLLESAAKLTRLTLDWQEELSFPGGEERFPSDWFSTMIRKDTWVTLAARLTRLDITFPAAYGPNHYGLPLQDFTELFKHLGNLRSLRLVAAGMEGPFPLLPTLSLCPRLEELELCRTPVFVPDSMWVNTDFIHKSLKSFHLLDELSSLTQQPHLVSVIATYMPALEELEIQPQTILGYTGLHPNQMRKLGQLANLKRLSIPLSVKECTSNMPAVIYVLKEFKALRNLILSWGMWCDNHNAQNVQVGYLMSWLYITLGGFNSRIRVQLHIHHHHREYVQPSFMIW